MWTVCALALADKCRPQQRRFAVYDREQQRLIDWHCDRRGLARRYKYRESAQGVADSLNSKGDRQC